MDRSPSLTDTGLLLLPPCPGRQPKSPLTFTAISAGLPDAHTLKGGWGVTLIFCGLTVFKT